MVLAEAPRARSAFERLFHFRESTAQVGFLPALDGLRGLSVIAVTGAHFGVPVLISLSGFAVDVFFVLSGYLITRVLQRAMEARKPLSVFYWDRFVRLFPTLLVVALFLLLFRPDGLSTWSAALDAIGTLTYVTNWTRAFPTAGGPDYMGHTWSLSTEEQFYLLWPLALTLILGRSQKPLVVVATVTAVAITWALCVVAFGASYARFYNGFDTRCPALLIGTCLAFMPAFTWRQRVAIALPVVALTLLLPLFVTFSATPTTMCLGIAIVVWPTAMLLVDYGRDPAARGIFIGFLKRPELCFFGIISYPLYLWHYPIAHHFRDKLNMSDLDAALIGIPLSIILAYFTTVLVEMPCRRFRDNLDTTWRQMLGRIVAVALPVAILGGLIFFYGGFITTGRYALPS